MGVDPAWHRKLQQQRQASRVLVQAADHCLRNSIEVPSRLLRKLPAAAGSLHHHGFKLPIRVAALVQDMGRDDQQRGQNSNDGWKTQRKDKKSKEQWAVEKEEECLRLAKCSWVACNKGRCKVWLHFEDFESCVCPSCHRRWSDQVLQ